MAFDNSVTIVGNVVRDPEMRHTSNGVPVLTLSIAWNHRTTDYRTNTVTERPSFFDVTCWDSLARNIAESVGKGDRVMVNGYLQQRTWETEEGERRSRVEIVASEVSPSMRWASAKVTKNPRPEPAAAPATDEMSDEEVEAFVI